MAFVTALGLTAAKSRVKLCARSKAVVRCCLSGRVSELIREQIANPLFNVGSAPVELQSVFERLEKEGMFVGLDDVPGRGIGAQAAEVIRANVDDSIAKARDAVVKAFPGIAEKGGALYPEERAAACWRDLSEFARVVAYGIAVQRTPYSAQGLEIMKELYKELAVPLDAMILGVETLSATLCQCTDDRDQQLAIGHGFATLLEILSTF